MPAAAALAGRAVQASPDLWGPYRLLIGSIVRSVLPVIDVVVLGVCSPDELVNWPPASWLLLDCDEKERRHRLASRPDREAQEAVTDATAYRRLGLPVVDTSGRTVVAADLAAIITAS